ncbi:phosphogluconate dehydratase [Verminephrobacter eiseniae]|uniref:phosphogluconate dehydratase n=1 Tax=Verminephrobacter eiseniae TaxID=364317 RepID=UPI0022382A40|nr:phosphogluconate dehydratase [Verminephrobacter eiseniae]
METPIHSVVARVTARIVGRSADSRRAYLAGIAAMLARPPAQDRMGCANLAHAYAALPGADKIRVTLEKAPHIGVVTAYNDMLSAHQPYQNYPALLRAEAARQQATLQVAGGVPAMCDGITQGTPSMELSLFSRDTIAQATAVALSHDVFDGALLLGVCDKIVPGLLIGALHYGHLPCVFVPAGPMGSGLSNKEKSSVREQYVQGRVGRDELLRAESAAYHSPGTCTFYGTANSNQMLLEAMGLHVPGAAFAPPDSQEREAFTRAAVRTVLAIGQRGQRFTPIGRLVDERCIVNAMVALLATGGSTNHLIHWVAIARSAGMVIDWSDFDELSSAVPLLARIYPNGEADVNQFQAAGGPAWILRELLAHGLMHADALSVNAGGIAAGAQGAPLRSGDDSVLRPARQPFSATGGLRLLQGRLGRAVIKVSAVPEEHHVVQAPARVFDAQEDLLAAFNAGQMQQDLVAVVRFQGPQANGMPELHKLTPPLAVLQNQGFRVALVTDGRMSGASGKVPAAIHVTPEALSGGPLAKLRDGDIVRVDAVAGTLDVLLDDAEWAARTPAACTAPAATGFGRELFHHFRRHAGGAEQGACTWL